MPIIDTPLRYFITVSVGDIPVSYQREVQRRLEDEKGVGIGNPAIVVEDITAEQFDLVFTHGAVALTAEVQTAWGRVSDANALALAHETEAARVTAIANELAAGLAQERAQKQTALEREGAAIDEKVAAEAARMAADLARADAQVAHAASLAVAVAAEQLRVQAIAERDAAITEKATVGAERDALVAADLARRGRL